MAYSLRTLIETRADGRCEYCRRYQEPIGKIFFEVEHIVPRVQGGLTVPHNLAFACRHCNLYKSTATEAVDPETDQAVRLFILALINGLSTLNAALIGCSFWGGQQLVAQPPYVCVSMMRVNSGPGKFIATTSTHCFHSIRLSPQNFVFRTA